MSIPALFISAPFIIGYICLAILFIIQLLYNLVLYNQIPKNKTKVDEQLALPPLSIIICVENQIAFLKKNITSIMEQDYPNYEVILVDMASNDDTKIYLEHLEKQYPNLYFSFIPPTARFISKRKLAQTIGIKASKNEWLVFTDIDCRPTTNQWLRTMMSSMNSKTELILGYSQYAQEEGNLNHFIAYDNQLNQMRFLGLALEHLPYIGMGRNLAYKKELFNKDPKTFNNQLNLQRGEDYLFVNQHATPENTVVVTAPEAGIEVQPLNKLKTWRELKRYYLLSTKRLVGRQQYIIGLETTTRLLFYLLSFGLFIFSLIHLAWIVSGIVFSLFLLRWGIQVIVTNRVAKSVNDKRRYLFSLLFFDLILPLRNQLIRLTLPRKKRGDIVEIS